MSDRQNSRQRRAGFTLLELLVVLAILGLLAAFAAPRVTRLLGGAKSDAAAFQIDAFENALEFYRIDVGRYPSTAEGLDSLVERPSGVAGWSGPYLEKDGGLTDPWGNPYRYRAPGQHGDFDIWSLGADGVEGGEGENADITSWSAA